jgi:Fe-S-cluster containining protein
MGGKGDKDEEDEGFVIHYARGKAGKSPNEYVFYYPKELRWGCKKCGTCCRDASHRPRRILLLPTDIDRLEKAGEKEFSVEIPGENPFVAELRKNRGACIYLTQKGCGVYPHRALLCRTYPFWIERDGNIFEIMVDSRCPGIGHGGGLDESFYRDLLMEALEQRGL